MTCTDARGQLSALLDDALSVVERSALEAHLATCADCRRELAALRGTVTLLGRLGPAHAPAGFVDQVVSEAYRPSRRRRLFDVLFRPLRIKLPLEAAAVVLVGLSALYVHERMPEVRQLPRPAVPAPAPPVATPPPVAGAAGNASPAQTGEVRAKVAPAEQERVQPGAAPTMTPPGPGAVEAPGARAGLTPAPMADLRAETAPAATPEVKSDAKDAKKEAQVEPRRDVTGGPTALAKNEKAPPSAAPAPSRDAITPHPGAPPAVAAAPSAAAPASAAETRGRAGALGAAPPAAPPHESAGGSAAAAQKSRTAAARLIRPADASGRLVVSATEPAEIALDALLGRLGATRVARRVEQTPGPVLVDVNIPAARYHDLLDGLGKIGRWTTERESKTLPLEIRLEVAITVEP